MVDDFIPEIWTAQILDTLRTSLVYGGPGVVNRDYEGDISKAGDTVHITSFGDPTIRTYTPEANITVDSISDATRALLIDQMKVWAFDVDDVVARQALPGWVEKVASRSGYLLAQTSDSFLAALLYAAVNATANDYGAFVADISDNTAYKLFVELRTILNRDDVPALGRFAVVPPELTGALLQDPRFINASASGSTDPLRNGEVGRIAGFTVYESNATPDPTSGTFAVIAGHPIATTYAEQLVETKAQERELRFGHLLKGLHVYGAKVVRPAALAMASVTVQA